MIPIGSEVILPGTTATGILKFVGSVEGKHGTFAGVEIIGDTVKGKNNGDANGVRYFITERPNTGLFLPWLKLLAANDIDTASPNKLHEDQINERNPDTEIIEQLQNKLIEKDKRLSKQKLKYEEQRDEFRDVIRTLEDQLQENNQMYSERIKELEIELKGLNISNYQSQLKTLQLELQKRDDKLKESNSLIELLQQDKHELEITIKNLNDELKLKDNELQNHTNDQIIQLEREVSQLKLSNVKSRDQENKHDSQILKDIINVERRQKAPIKPKTIEIITTDELPVYTPEVKLDPTLGREKWCGLCERTGHDSIDCELI